HGKPRLASRASGGLAGDRCKTMPGNAYGVMNRRSVERAAIISDGYLGHVVHHGLAHRIESEHESAEQVSEGLRCVVSHGRDHGQRTRGLQDLIADRAAFDAVAVENRLRSLALANERQFPGEIESVLHAGVHALPAGRTVDMRGVAGHEDAARTII